MSGYCFIKKTYFIPKKLKNGFLEFTPSFYYPVDKNQKDINTVGYYKHFSIMK